MTVAFHHETKRLILRSWRDEDVDVFEAACNTPAVTRFLGGLQTREEISSAIARIRACEEKHGYCFWAMERRSDGEFLGFCGLKTLSADGARPNILGEPEIGWRLRQSAWGQGYAFEAALASLELAFRRFGMPQVYAMTLVENGASWGLMKRLGMTAMQHYDFDMPRYGRHVVYRIGREEWTG